jgi:hypothetical protein
MADAKPAIQEATLRKGGQVASFQNLENLLFEFETTLCRQGIHIQSGSELEGACCSILEVLAKHQDRTIRNPQEDIRQVFTEVLGIWIFLQKVVRLQNHPSFPTFVPHLNLLNEGTVVQNKRLRASQDAANKIFELLFALVLLDLSPDVALADPDLEDTSNPDILATIHGQRWGFACKTVYGPSGKTFFDRLKEGVDQIEVSQAQVGCVMVNFRNLIDHNAFWPIMNEAEHRAGAEPVFGTSIDTSSAGPALCDHVTLKRNQVDEEIGQEHVLNMYARKKALPGFLCFCQTCAGQVTPAGPVPASIITLVLGTFAHCDAYMPIFLALNEALHERVHNNTQ